MGMEPARICCLLNTCLLLFLLFLLSLAQLTPVASFNHYQPVPQEANATTASSSSSDLVISGGKLIKDVQSGSNKLPHPFGGGQPTQGRRQQPQALIPTLAKKFAILGNSSNLFHLQKQQVFQPHQRYLQGLADHQALNHPAQLLSTLTANDHHQLFGAHRGSAPGQSTRRMGLLEKICIGTSNRMAPQQNKSEHYQNLVERYKNCTYVIGNLEITWLDRSSSAAEQIDLSFLESIREITGYLLIAYVDVDKIRMPNLQIIRGRDLFKMDSDEKEEFAMILIENELHQLELPNLREILAGSVGSYNNRNLCHIRTINWDEILNWPMYRSVFVYNGTEPECPPCDTTCQGSCWSGSSPEMCQKFSKVNCSPACGNGRCFGPTQNECCHSYCAGGCTGSNQTDCLACKNFYDDGSCIQECPSMMRYNPSKFSWEPNPNGKFAFGATCVRECPEHMLRDSGACVRVCPPNKRSFNGECVPCGGPCPKNCQGVEVVHSDNIDQLINCTVIEGSITILDDSFAGYSEVSPHGTNQTVRHRPMHPSRLEVFKTLREITGYLNIRAKHPDFRDLSYFSNLKSIDGRQTTDMFHALSITRSSLVSLNLRSLHNIRVGKINIEENPELCFADTIDWLQLNISRREDVTIRNNAEASRCRSVGLQCHEQCARDGCWGPGPDECLSCNNYKLDNYCVVNCSSTESLGFLSYEDSKGSRMCKRCHPECKLGCNGTEARHCLACRHVRDGPYCVSECPSHKYNNQGFCEECDKSCADGCTGPSNKLGEGGCSSCAKAVIKSTDPMAFDVQCIGAEEQCHDGYYQEYVVGSSQPEGSPLKSSSGRPVCRRCHRRCKRCIGMGTHKTVCECAKYVAGEQCEDFCPRDYFADEQSRQCVKCSPECNGCLGPTEADCISCRVYRIYHDSNVPSSTMSADQSAMLDISPNNGQSNTASRQQIKFNCTAQCPPDKPHRISESNMLDPYCSEDPGVDIESPLIVSLGSTSILFALVIMAALMFCISIYRCQIEKDKTVKLTMHLSGIDDVEPLNPSNLKPNLAPLRSIKETELRKGKELGSGFGGTVYQGFWRPEGQEHKAPRPVAIKVLRDNGQSNMNKEFLDEAYIMASVSHPNLVRLLAVCMTPKHLMLVTQLMPLGCLRDYVKKNKKDIGSKNLLEWGKQIARGMAYLEEHRMVHRDLALRNVLLQTSGRALISDFGLAKFLEVDQSEYHSGGGRLPIKWLAPECIRERKFTHKSDVWAFGVTLWELVSFGARPFDEYDTKDVPLAVEKGARLQQPSYVSAEVYKVMYACWFYNPDDRPNFKSLLQNFVNFARDPERYLICGAKGIELCKGVSSGRNSDSDEYSAEENSLSGEESAMTSPTTLSSQPPLSAMPDLTPSTHNRINETVFGFDVRLRQHRAASESESVVGHSHQLTNGNLSTPTLKKLAMFSGRNPSQIIEEDVFAKPPHHGLMSSGKVSSTLMTDVNNNNPFMANGNNSNNNANSTSNSNNTNNNSNNSCWSMHHTNSSNSLGKSSFLIIEQNVSDGALELEAN